MQNDIAIRVKGLSKVYQKKNKNGDQEDFYALKDVNFEVKKGEVVGIIGKNGSGKSTLLKILSGVTKPTTGSVEINGTVASILDVGTGFHADLSGRENVYLRGKLLGMSTKEIDKAFDEIVEFSEIGDFIETPVKNYSSGMFLRLAFSILVFLKCDVLLLDEVLSVGDLGFRGKSNLAINKLVNYKEKTIIFVSHDMNQFNSLDLDFIIFLKNGNARIENNFNKILDVYLDENLNLPSLRSKSVISLSNNQKVEISNFIFENEETQAISFDVRTDKDACVFDIALLINDQQKKNISTIYKENYKLLKSHKIIKISFINNPFFNGYFFVNLIFDYKSKYRIELKNIFYFFVDNEKQMILGQLKLNTKWN